MSDAARPLRVLLVEDSENDALLLLRALARGGYAPRAERVDSAPALRAALAAGGWDVVLCDYVIPGFGGPQAVAMIRAHAPELPVIMVSGEVGEEAAVTAMRAGAADFVMKGRLSRLLPALEREFAEAAARAARRRAEDALAASDAHLRAIIEQAPFGMQRFAPDGRCLQSNAAWGELWSADPARAQGWNIITSEEPGRYAMRDLMRRAFAGEPYRLDEFFWDPAAHGRSGAPRYIDIQICPIRDAAGQVVEVVLASHDATARRRAVDALRTSREQIEELMHGIGGIVWEADPATFAFSFVSSQAERLLGYPAQDWLRAGFWAAHVHPDDYAEAARFCQQATRELRDHAFEYRMRAADGRWLWLHDVVSVISADGAPVRLRGLMLDVTARREADSALRAAEERLRGELEQRVTERTAELETAVRDLEAFSYTVSHDLRAPLRAIDGFTRVLRDEHGDALSPAGRAQLERVCAAAGRMGHLIDHLLELSRVARAEVRRQRVDLTALARAVLAELQAAHPQRQVAVAVADGLTASADATLARALLENLLGNAWKYTARRPDARIEVGASVGREGVVYHVRDNGAGFDMAEAGKLFAPFQRLHAEEEFAGSGVGLATVERIVRRHGGRIWAEAAPGAGATFSFTLEQPAAGRARRRARAAAG